MPAILTNPENILRAARWRAQRREAEREAAEGPVLYRSIDTRLRMSGTPTPSPTRPPVAASTARPRIIPVAPEQAERILREALRAMGRPRFAAALKEITGEDWPLPVRRPQPTPPRPARLADRVAVAQRLTETAARPRLASHVREAWPQVRATLRGGELARWERIGAQLNARGALQLSSADYHWALGVLDRYGRTHGFSAAGRGRR